MQFAPCERRTDSQVRRRLFHGERRYTGRQQGVRIERARRLSHSRRPQQEDGICLRRHPARPPARPAVRVAVDLLHRSRRQDSRDRSQRQSGECRARHCGDAREAERAEALLTSANSRADPDRSAPVLTTLLNRRLDAQNGTRGTVTQALPSDDHWNLMIEWSLPGTPHRAWYNKHELETYMHWLPRPTG